ncbi:MAG: DUF3604 domain-containing protein [Gemmatimonadota bacterium]|nr:MAG: DUF3604 domain-containing protein [Gemmatimonadota bacterium]
MWLRGFGVLVAALALPVVALAQDAGHPPAEVLSGLYPGRTYSPYAGRSFPSHVYWGDTHLHTANSPDASLFGNTLGLEDAYRALRGEEVMSATGLPFKLSRPLDWVVIADHAELIGFGPDVRRGAPNILAVPKGKEWYEGMQQGGQAGAEAAIDLVLNFTRGTLPPEFVRDYSAGSRVYATVWDDIAETADRFNEPGKFTAFIGFEWSSIPDGKNLHRVVVFRDGAERATQVEPISAMPPPFGSTNPRDLWNWMQAYEDKSGGQVFALAHNGNLSNGWMFPLDQTLTAGAIDDAYIQQRAKWEPLYEVTQIKGDGEAHPFLSPDDEFADYENWDKGNLNMTELKEPEMYGGEYAREGLKRGLLLERRFGTNPYKFGLAGATDAHTSLAAVEEDNFFGKSASAEPSAERVRHPFVETELGAYEGYQLVSSGYQGVWATENTRNAIWDAMVRRETYATTGPRMVVRFFGGWEFDEDDIRSRAPAFIGYEKGVPMGGDLRPRTGDAPTFMVYALRDPIGANLDRIQIIKGWMGSSGETHERVYDVAVSDGRRIGSDGRCRTPVGNSVDLEAASWTNTIGDSELAAVWTDPDFDPSQPAFYYARVLEIPTPRWVVYDRVRLGAEIPDEAELIGQERAYTSPIWYTP